MKTFFFLIVGCVFSVCAATEIAETDYNVALDVPVSLICDRSADERLAFDFTSYATPDDLKSGTPTVRALVQRATIEKMGLGMMIILR